MTEKNSLRLFPEPVVMAGNHEPLIFRRRRGSARADEAERFACEHSEELVKKLAARGATWVRTHFFKGFGLEAEREEIEMTRAFTALCHRYGIKVELYTQFGTLQYETFLVEEPRMLEWCAVTEEGRYASITYDHHDFRYKPCLVRDGYWEYLKKVLELGVRHVKADAFGFDNVCHPGEPEACHCPDCRAAFVRHLKTKYPTDSPGGRERATERFGFATLDHVQPPRFNRWNPVVMYRVIKSPVMQEWVEFRCDVIARRLEEIWRTVKGLKPDMVVEHNIYGGFGCNGAWFGGSDIRRLLPWTDAFWNECGPDAPGITADGRVLHRMHAYKLAQAYGNVVFEWNAGSTPEQRKLALAEGLAANHGHVAGFGYTVDFANGSFPEADAFIAFRKGRAELFDGAHPAADVALVEHPRSLNYDGVSTHYAEVLAFGSLLAGHVPFHLVTGLVAADLRRRAAIVLPNVKYMSDDEARGVLDYVKAGGAAVVTGETALWDDWGRRRREGALAEMLGDVSGATTPRRGEFGRGRFVYIPRLEEVKPFVDVQSEWQIGPERWHLPKNFKAFIEAVKWAAADKLAVEVSGPTGLAAEVTRTPDGRLVVHLVNYNLRKPAAKVSLKVRVVVVAATLHSPWAKPKPLRAKKSSGAATVAVGTVARYAVVEIKS